MRSSPRSAARRGHHRPRATRSADRQAAVLSARAARSASDPRAATSASRRHCAPSRRHRARAYTGPGPPIGMRMLDSGACPTDRTSASRVPSRTFAGRTHPSWPCRGREWLVIGMALLRDRPIARWFGSLTSRCRAGMAGEPWRRAPSAKHVHGWAPTQWSGCTSARRRSGRRARHPLPAPRPSAAPFVEAPRYVS
jgi:hypothetical protein